MAATSLPHLETVAMAAELASFTAAGKALGLTQAAVSQRIQALEKLLGVSQFACRGGRVILTEAGQRLDDYGLRILALHREAFQEVTGQPAPLVGELTLAASSVPGEHLRPELLSVFRERYPMGMCGPSSRIALRYFATWSAVRLTLGW
jgi:DNA-binding transcriptional LysR family regulator